MPFCFAPGCGHDSRRNTCKFFRFPKLETCRRKWTKACRRADKLPGQEDRLCSCHFVDGKKEGGPVMFAHNLGKFHKFPSPAKANKRRKQLLTDEAAAEESTHEAIPQPEPTPSTSGKKDEPLLPALLEAENYFLKQENATLAKDLQVRKSRMCIENIADNDSLVFHYTGLPTYQHFNLLLRLTQRFNLNYFCGWKVEALSQADQLLCTLMKLRHNFTNIDLSFRFQESHTTIHNIFFTYVYALHEILFKGIMDKIPARTKNAVMLPAAFANFPNCRIVLDCTEVEVAIPHKSLKEQKVVFSHYKQRCTFKVLIGVAPNGVVTYCSELYPGSTSDKFITEHCGVISHFHAGDLVLADKGFLIGEALSRVSVSLNIPPFLTNPQFTQEEVLQTRKIARARIHVERAIQRLKSFRILSFISPSIRPHANAVTQVCAALINFQYALLKENEQCLSEEVW